MKTQFVLPVLILLMIACSPKQQPEEAISPMIILQSPAGENASLPYLITGEDGNLYFSWVEKKDSNWVELKYATKQGDNWSEPELIAKGNNWFVNWADYPMIAIDKEGNMLAHFLAKSSSGTYSYDVNVVAKPKGGKWSDSIVPHKDNTPTEHGFVTMLPQSDGTFRLAWLDGRKTGGVEHGGEEGHGGGGAMTIRTAVMDMSGSLTEEAELDGRVCDCCQTSGIMTSNGPMIAFRDRSETEIRDISFVKLTDEGWTDPESINADNWNIAGCPVNGPRMAALGSTVATAWFTAAADQPNVKVAFSNDGGSFGPAIVVDETTPVGRVDVILLDENTAMVSWLDNEGSTAIKYRKVKIDGTMTDPVLVSQTSDSRGSGFPQMALLDGKAYFAWTSNEEGKGTQVMMAMTGE